MVSLPIAQTSQLEPKQNPAVAETLSIDAFMQQPIDGMEWVDGQLLEKTGMTLRHGLVQSRLDSAWRVFKEASGQGGEVLTEAPCRTIKQVRRPDVAYVTTALLNQYGTAAVAPQSFPLIAEIVSPTDSMEDLFAKAQGYLESGSSEVWLILPESRYGFILTEPQRLWVAIDQVMATQTVLPGFTIALSDLLA